LLAGQPVLTSNLGSYQYARVARDNWFDVKDEVMWKIGAGAMRMSLILAGIGAANPVFAQETTTYTYDAKGRLVAVMHSGGPASGRSTTYLNDPANNRKAINVTVSPNNAEGRPYKRNNRQKQIDGINLCT